MTFRVEFTPRAAREFADLDRVTRRRVAAALERLGADPAAASNVKALAGGGFRLRVGDHRVLFELIGARLVVLVVKIGHRREVYR